MKGLAGPHARGYHEVPDDGGLAACGTRGRGGVWVPVVEVPDPIDPDLRVGITPWGAQVRPCARCWVSPRVPDVVARVTELLEIGPFTLEVVAKDVGYTDPRNLERVLYRAGRRDLVHRLIPGRRCQEDIEARSTSPKSLHRR